MNYQRPWTDADDAIIATHIGEMSIDRLAKLIHRHRDATIRRCRALGYVTGTRVRGWDTIESAVRRTGFCEATLRRMRAMFRWRSQPAVVNSRSLRKRGNAKPRWKLYRISDIDAAAEWWQSTETVNEAAERVKVHHRMLSAILADMGYVRPPMRTHWRIPSEAIDEAASRYRSTISAAEYAKMRGMHVNTVQRRIRAEGIIRTSGCQHRMTVEQYDGFFERTPFRRDCKREKK